MEIIIKIFRGLLLILGYIIKILALFNHRLYMRAYTPCLKALGIDINGSPIFIAPIVKFDVAYCSFIHLSDKVVIANGVNILAHDFSISRGVEALGILRKEFPILRDVYIGENTFIGVNSIILPGARIGKNVIIGAGSVVRGIIPDNSLVVGNPAQIVCQTTEWASKKIDQNPQWEKFLNGSILTNPKTS